MDNPFDEAFGAFREPEPMSVPQGHGGVAKAAPSKPGSIRIFPEMIQGSEEWHAARCGLLTASEMKLIITPTLKMAANDKERAHVCELAAQRITGYVEPHYISDDMLRGHDDEVDATLLYSQRYAPVEQIGFITNDRWGFMLGYSPDAKLVGQNAGIENKSRRQKFQIDTICNLDVPVDYAIQLQTGLLVSEWEWLDFNSYCGGLEMVTLRVFPDPVVQAAIIEAAGECERRIAARIATYRERQASDARLIPTERKIEQEMFT